MSIRGLRMFRLTSVAGLILLSSAGIAGGCSSESKGGNGGTGGNPGTGGGAGTGGGGNACTGGPATSPADDHCQSDGSPIVQPTGACVSGSVDAGMVMGDAGAPEVLPGPWGGTAAADDDCKYDVSYTVTPICENQDVTVTVTVKSRVTHSGVTGASPDLEVLDPTGLPAAAGNQVATEKSGGVYEIKPIRFDKAGKWTIRFHLFETCSDALEDSPHGHVAFFVDVP